METTQVPRQMCLESNESFVDEQPTGFKVHMYQYIKIVLIRVDKPTEYQPLAFTISCAKCPQDG